MTGNEVAGRTAKQFDTKESANRPVLTINYVPPVPDLTVSKSHAGTFRQGDAADTYTIAVNNVGSGPTTAPVTVTDTLPAGLTPTPADSGTVNGWTLTTTGQTITATLRGRACRRRQLSRTDPDRRRLADRAGQRHQHGDGRRWR